MAAKKSVLLADDHPMIRGGIRSLLEDLEDFEVVYEAENGKEAVKKTLEIRPDMIILDISMPEMTGIEAIGIIKKTYPNALILILSMHDEPHYIMEVLKSGANGYVLKNAGKSELEKAILAVADGETFYSPHISDVIFNSYLEKEKKASSPDPLASLTRREKEILALIADGRITKEIADHLCISPRTVDTHRTNIMRKLEIRNAAGLVRFAIENDLK